MVRLDLIQPDARQEGPVTTTTEPRGPGRPKLPRPEPTSYLRTAEVADILQVSPKTVSRWAKEGKLPFLKTLGGHRRYPEAKIRQMLADLNEIPEGWTTPPAKYSTPQQ